VLALGARFEVGVRGEVPRHFAAEGLFGRGHIGPIFVDDVVERAVHVLVEHRDAELLVLVEIVRPEDHRDADAGVLQPVEDQVGDFGLGGRHAQVGEGGGDLVRADEQKVGAPFALEQEEAALGEG
jgi:hypothetical protein